MRDGITVSNAILTCVILAFYQAVRSYVGKAIHPMNLACYKRHHRPIRTRMLFVVRPEMGGRINLRAAPAMEKLEPLEELLVKFLAVSRNSPAAAVEPEPVHAEHD
ncbi:hypothetical protein F4824DRAFT_447790, partial [Ustulina deusta]